VGNARWDIFGDEKEGMLDPCALQKYGSDGRLLYVLLDFGRVELCMAAVADFDHRLGALVAEAWRVLDDTHPWVVFAQRVQRVRQYSIFSRNGQPNAAHCHARSCPILGHVQQYWTWPVNGRRGYHGTGQRRRKPKPPAGSTTQSENSQPSKRKGAAQGLLPRVPDAPHPLASQRAPPTHGRDLDRPPAAPRRGRGG